MSQCQLRRGSALRGGSSGEWAQRNRSTLARRGTAAEERLGAGAGEAFGVPATAVGDRLLRGTRWHRSGGRVSRRKIDAEFTAVLDAVAASPPARFSGGGKWEAMHGTMSGWYEIRLTGPGREQFRLFCLLENADDDELLRRGLTKPAIAVITGTGSRGAPRSLSETTSPCAGSARNTSAPTLGASRLEGAVDAPRRARVLRPAAAPHLRQLFQTAPPSADGHMPVARAGSTGAQGPSPRLDSE
jgi:hypothetical protein